MGIASPCIVLALFASVVALHAQPNGAHPAGVQTGPHGGRLVVLGGEVVDFGRTRPGSLTREVMITNAGTDTLRNLKALSSCGCTVAELARNWVAPGDTTVLHITAAASDYIGENWLKTVELTSNDPLRPTVLLTVKASFKHDARIASNINTIYRDSAKTAVLPWTVEVKNTGDSAIWINPPFIEESNGTLAEFDMKQPRRLAAGDTLTINGHVKLIDLSIPFPSAKAQISTSSNYDSQMWVNFFYAPEGKK